MESVDIVKFIATAIQLVGYKLTGLNIVPWNIFVFSIGIIWIIVGYMWKDKVIIVAVSYTHLTLPTTPYV